MRNKLIWLALGGFAGANEGFLIGSLLPLAVRAESTLILPAVYGLGTGLPVFAFAALLALGTNRVGAAFNRLSQAEWWARQGTGVAMLALGLYLTLHHVWRVV